MTVPGLRVTVTDRERLYIKLPLMSRRLPKQRHLPNLVKEHFVPGDSYAFPKVFMNGYKRSFRCARLKTYPWLVYSKSQDGGYCLPCVLFATAVTQTVRSRSVLSKQVSSRGVLVKTPFKKWTKVSDVCRTHQLCRYRENAQVAFDAFRRNMLYQEEGISSRINTESIAVVKKNREILESIAKTIYFCGKQGISLRGHRDDSSASRNVILATLLSCFDTVQNMVIQLSERIWSHVPETQLIAAKPSKTS